MTDRPSRSKAPDSMVCPQCSKSFKPGRTTTKFCSTNCRVNHHRQNQTESPVWDYKARMAAMVGNAREDGRWEKLASAYRWLGEELDEREQQHRQFQQSEARQRTAPDSIKELRRVIQANHPDKNPNGDRALYQAAVAKLATLKSRN